MRKSKKNLLDLIPHKKCTWEESDKGNITLIVPRFSNPLMKKLANKWGKSENIKIHCDELGTSTWHLIDGSRNVAQIGESLEKKMGEKVQPVYERLTTFMGILYKNKLITFKNY